MRIGLLTTLSIPALLIAGCSQGPSDRSDVSTGRTDAAAEASAGPGINVTAAPGVAFNYRYAFRLPSDRVAAAQETHASACEKLGVARCRITGMRYQLVGENDIRGMLQFKLDPTLARAFGKEGIAAIEAAKGKMIDAEINGTDAGAQIGELQKAKVGANDELRRIDEQLARKGLSNSERTELQSQRADIVARIASANAGTAEQRESLANTPMTFQYESGAGIRGFDASAPLTSAVDTAISSAQTTLALVLGFLAIFGPPGILAVLVWLLWRRVRPMFPARAAPRQGTRGAAAPEPTPSAPPPSDG